MSHQANTSLLVSAEIAQPASSLNYPLPPINCEITQHNLVVLCGLHPSHLSPYMNMLAGIDPPASGRVQLLGEDAFNLRPEQQQQLRQKAGFVLQGGPLLSVINGKENLKLAARYHQTGNEASIEEQAQQLLSEIPEQENHLLLPAYMSRLLRRHLAIARPLMLDPQILFIDNPFEGLGYHDRDIVASYVANIVINRGISVVVSTDDLTFSQLYADKIYFCDKQKILAFDSWQRFRSSWEPAILALLKQQLKTNA